MRFLALLPLMACLTVPPTPTVEEEVQDQELPVETAEVTDIEYEGDWTVIYAGTTGASLWQRDWHGRCIYYLSDYPTNTFQVSERPCN